MQASIDQIVEQLGGKESIGVKVRSESQMDLVLREGLPASVLAHFRENWGFTVMERNPFSLGAAGQAWPRVFAMQ